MQLCYQCEERAEPGTAVPLQVTFLGVSKDLEACAVMAAAQRAANPAATYECLTEGHFLPFTVSTQPFEQLSYAVLNWLLERQADCDVVQVSQCSCSLLVKRLCTYTWTCAAVGL